MAAYIWITNEAIYYEVINKSLKLCLNIHGNKFCELDVMVEHAFKINMENILIPIYGSLCNVDNNDCFCSSTTIIQKDLILNDTTKILSSNTNISPPSVAPIFEILSPVNKQTLITDIVIIIIQFNPHLFRFGMNVYIY